jgi:hypothetical protein
MGHDWYDFPLLLSHPFLYRHKKDRPKAVELERCS